MYTFSVTHRNVLCAYSCWSVVSSLVHMHTQSKGLVFWRSAGLLGNIVSPKLSSAVKSYSWNEADMRRMACTKNINQRKSLPSICLKFMSNRWSNACKYITIQNIVNISLTEHDYSCLYWVDFFLRSIMHQRQQTHICIRSPCKSQRVMKLNLT